MEQYGLYFFGIVFVFCMWLLRCNNKTCNFRGELIEAIFDRKDWQYLIALYRKSEYGTELWHRAFFLNWRKTYDRRLVEALPRIFK